MNAQIEFDQQSGNKPTSSTSSSSKVPEKTLGIKRSRTLSALNQSTQVDVSQLDNSQSTQIDQTLLPPSQDDVTFSQANTQNDDDEGAENVIITVRASETQKILRKTVQRNSLNKSSYLAQFYKVNGYTVETSYKIAGTKDVQNQLTGATQKKEVLLRQGPQVWRNSLNQIVRIRNFVNNKCEGRDVIFCYPICALRVAGSEPDTTANVYVRKIVCDRTFKNGLLEGVQTRNEVTSVVDSITNEKVFTFGKTRDTTIFSNGLKNGLETRIRLSDGKILSSVNFVKGLKDGVANFFSRKRLISSWYYRQGIRISGQSFYGNGNLKSELITDENGSAFVVYNQKGEVIRQTVLNTQGKKNGEQLFLIGGKPQTMTWSNGNRDDNGVISEKRSAREKRAKTNKNINDDDE